MCSLRYALLYVNTLQHTDGELLSFQPIFLNEVLIRLPTDPSPSGGNESADEDVPIFHVSHVDRVYTLRAENINERTAWTTKIKQASQVYIETEKRKREKAYHGMIFFGSLILLCRIRRNDNNKRFDFGF